MAARTAAGLLMLNGVGFGIPSVLGIRSLFQGRGIAFVMGFPAYGQGPFDRIGLHSTLPLLAGFLLVCLLECIAGILVWNGRKVGALLALILLPFGALYWWGFALPYAWVARVLATIAIAVSWRELV